MEKSTAGVPVSEHAIASALKHLYDIEAEQVCSLALGHASETWTYRAIAQQDCYFVKLKKVVPEAGFAVSQLLEASSLPVVAPIRSTRSNAWEEIGQFSLLVFPFVDAKPLIGLSCRTRHGPGLEKFFVLFIGQNSPMRLEASFPLKPSPLVDMNFSRK